MVMCWTKLGKINQKLGLVAHLSCRPRIVDLTAHAVTSENLRKFIRDLVAATDIISQRKHELPKVPMLLKNVESSESLANEHVRAETVWEFSCTEARRFQMFGCRDLRAIIPVD